MIQSMTGFGKASLQLPTKKITVELKSLNSKGLDLNTRMPSIYREMELGLRNQLSQRLERGKIDFSLYIEVTGEDTSSKINVPIIKGYIAQMKAIMPLADEVELMKMAIRMPDALKTEREEIDENEWKEIQKVIDSEEMPQDLPHVCLVTSKKHIMSSNLIFGIYCEVSIDTLK